MKYFILEPDLDLDFMIVAKTAIQFQIWKGRGDTVHLVHWYDEMGSGAKQIIPVGSVEFVNKIKLRATGSNLFVENWTDDIKPFVLQERYGECRLDELPFFPIFIKPKYDSKLFMGEVISSESSIDDLKMLVAQDERKKLRDDDIVYWSEVVNFVAEWRSIIHQGKVISFAPYDSDLKHHEDLFMRTPDAYQFVKRVAGSIDSTVARIVDVGLTDDGQFGVVEGANSILTASTYTTMIDREDYYKALCSVGFHVGIA